MENKQYRLACPYCGYSMMIDKLRAEGFKALTNWDIDWAVLQVRNIEGGPGRPAKDLGQRAHQMSQRRGGFPIDRAASKSIIQMSNDPEWKELSSMVAERIALIYGAYRATGIIKPEELK